MVLMEQRMATEHGLRNEKETKRCKKRDEIAEQTAQASGRLFAPIYLNPFKRSQLTLKFIRWLRYHIQTESSMNYAIRSLQRVYAML